MENPQKRPLLARIFVSPAEPRLRAGWRLVVQSMVNLAFLVGLLIPLVLAMLYLPMSSSTVLAISELIETFTVTLSVLLARLLLDRRSITSLGFKLDRWAIFDLLVGIGITLLLFGAIYLAMDLLGWIEFEGFAWQSEAASVVLVNIVVMFLVFVLVGWKEELLSRGYHLQTIASGLNLYWGVILSSIIFGLMHMFNPGAGWISTLGIFLAGLFLASGYLGTRQLWLSIGLHIGWNFFEGPVFGFPVSGVQLFHLTRITVSGPELWTGGVFGPEAGLIVIPAMVLGGLMVFAYARLRRKWNPGLSSDHLGTS